MTFKPTASHPPFARLLRRHWGADLADIKPESATPEQLYRAISHQAALTQQLVEELASYMGKSDDFTMNVPINITVDGTREPDGGGPGVPDGACGQGWAALEVRNYGSVYNATTGMIEGGHAAIFEGVTALDDVCLSGKIRGTCLELGDALAIAFQLSGGFGAGATVLDYYNGDDPGPTATVLDPENLFPNALTNAKGFAVYSPCDDAFIASYAEESTTIATGGTVIQAGCGIDITGNTVSVNAGNLAGSGLGVSGTCALNVNLGCGLAFSGDNVVIDATDFAGDGLVAPGTCLLQVQGGDGITVDETGVYIDTTYLDTYITNIVYSTSKGIVFKLLGDLRPGYASASVQQSWPSEPLTPSTVTVWDSNRDSNSHGPFRYGMGPISGGAEGCFGTAIWDNVDSKWRVVTCDTIAKRIAVTLAGNMQTGSTYYAPVSVDDFYDGQSPGAALTRVYDQQKLYKFALAGCKGYATLDDRWTGSGGPYGGDPARYVFSVLDQQAEFVKGTASSHDCENTGTVSVIGYEVISARLRGKDPGSITVKNPFGVFIPSGGREFIALHNSSTSNYELLGVRNTNLVTGVVAHWAVNAPTIDWTELQLCVPRVTSGTDEYTGTEC